jgi:hypothetical protein
LSVAAAARLSALWNGDLVWRFRQSPLAVTSALILIVCVGGALLAPWHPYTRMLLAAVPDLTLAEAWLA